LHNSSCHLAWVPDAGLDVFGNALVQDQLSVSAFVADVQQPILIGSDLNMNTSTLTLSFSEAINSSSFIAQGFALQNVLDYTAQPIVTYNLSITSGGLTTILSMEFTNETDTQMPSYVKLVAWRGESWSNFTNLSFFCIGSTFTMRDGVLVQNESPGVGGTMVYSTQIRSNSTPSYVITLNDYLQESPYASLTYRTSVAPFASFQLTPTALDARKVNVREQRQLVDSSLVFSTGTTLVVRVGPHDEDYLKQTLQLARSRVFTLVRCLPYAVEDMNKNQLTEITNSRALTTNQFVADVTRPYLQSFVVDMTARLITLTFSEVLEHKIDVTKLSFVDFNTSVALSALSQVTSHIDRVLVIAVSASDANKYACLNQVLVSANTSWVVVTPNFANDTNKNMLTAVSLEVSLAASDFNVDAVAPTLDQFTLNMSTGRLTYST